MTANERTWEAPVAGWWLVGALALASTACLVAGATRLGRTAGERIRVPARLLQRSQRGDIATLIVEYADHSGKPHRTAVRVERQYGRGALPEFSGWVWIRRANAQDVRTRPDRGLRHGSGGLIAGAVIGGVAFVMACLLAMQAWADGLGL